MRSRLVIVLGLLALAAVGVLGSGAAFVDEQQRDQPVSADRVSRWLHLDAPEQGTCAPAESTRATGADESTRLAVGGAAAERTADCVLVLRAVDAFPEDVESITVGLAPSGAGVDEAELTTLDGGTGDATLRAGERRALRLRVSGPAAGTAALAITVAFDGEASGFLRYDVPVAICGDDLASSCAAPEPEPTETTEPTAPGGGEPAAPAAPAPDVVLPIATDDGAVAGEVTTSRCRSRRRFTIHIRRRAGVRYASARVYVQNREVRVLRGRRLRARIDLRGFKRRVVTVRIVVRTTDGHVLRGKRRYRTCTRKRPSRGPKL